MTQQKLTERHRDLASKGFISASKLEEMEAQNVSTREQLTRAAKNLSRTRIVSPVDGRVDNRMVSVGDWIDLGKPVFQLSTSENLRIRLPFPETAASRIKLGQTVTLSTPTAPDQVHEWQDRASAPGNWWRPRALSTPSSPSPTLATGNQAPRSTARW